MKIYRWVGPRPNFGDDLNLFLWNHLMPEVVADPDDGALLIGVGTVLSASLPQASPRVVMGSGVGYSRAPSSIQGPGWMTYAVRGPLTARLLGLPDDRAVIDPAVLLPQMDGWDVGEGDAIFIPHWETAPLAEWRDAAEQAGLRWVDPCGEARSVIQQIAGAKLVVAESMHAAIIADAFRKPWVPVIGTHRSSFKWKDWTGSLELDYDPTPVGPWAKIQMKLAPNAQYGAADIATPSDPDKRSAAAPQRPSLKARATQLLRRGIDSLPRSVSTGLIARDLRAAARRRPCRSRDDVLSARQALLMERVYQLREDYGAGRVAGHHAG